jgi:CTP:molybdopterin cytidylyltransferase MocA
MGRPKLSLLLGGRTVLEHVIAALRQGGVDEVLVIVGPHDLALPSLAEAAGACVLSLSEPTADMRVTVEHGLRWLEQRFYPKPDDAWLLAPADHPTLDADVVRRLCEAYTAQPLGSIVIPVHDGRRGHPTLLAWRHVAGIRAHPGQKGINDYVRLHGAEIQQVRGASASLLDLDTPKDYERLRRSWPVSRSIGEGLAP